MLVKAVSIGYHGEKRRKAGEVFELRDRKYKKEVESKDKDGKVIKNVTELKMTAEDQFSPAWMEKVEEEELDKKQLSKVKSSKIAEEDEEVI